MNTIQISSVSGDGIAAAGLTDGLASGCAPQQAACEVRYKCAAQVRRHPVILRPGRPPVCEHVALRGTGALAEVRDHGPERDAVEQRLRDDSLGAAFRLLEAVLQVAQARLRVVRLLLKFFPLPFQLQCPSLEFADLVLD